MKTSDAVASMTKFCFNLFLRFEAVNLPCKHIELIKTCRVPEADDSAFFQ